MLKLPAMIGELLSSFLKGIYMYSRIIFLYSLIPFILSQNSQRLYYILPINKKNRIHLRGSFKNRISTPCNDKIMYSYELFLII